MRHMRFNVRRLCAMVAIAGASSVVACDQDRLLTVPTPDVVLPGDLTGPAVLPNAYAAAIGDFQVA